MHIIFETYVNVRRQNVWWNWWIKKMRNKLQSFTLKSSTPNSSADRITVILGALFLWHSYPISNCWNSSSSPLFFVCSFYSVAFAANMCTYHFAKCINWNRVFITGEEKEREENRRKLNNCCVWLLCWATHDIYYKTLVKKQPTFRFFFLLLVRAE